MHSKLVQMRAFCQRPLAARDEHAQAAASPIPRRASSFDGRMAQVSVVRDARQAGGGETAGHYVWHDDLHALEFREVPE